MRLYTYIYPQQSLRNTFIYKNTQIKKATINLHWNRKKNLYSKLNRNTPHASINTHFSALYMNCTQYLAQNHQKQYTYLITG